MLPGTWLPCGTTVSRRCLSPSGQLQWQSLLLGPDGNPSKPPSLRLRGTAADAASDRLGLPRPGQAFALSHFSNASRSAPHWTGRDQDKRGSGDGDKECKIFFSQCLQARVPGAMQRVALAERCFAEPGPRFLRIASDRGPGSAAHRFARAARCAASGARKSAVHENVNVCLSPSVRPALSYSGPVQ